MSFLSPLTLLWFIPLAAAIIVLYLLKLRRKERIVSSVMLWQDAVADIQANAPFQKFKKSLLLLLQLIALALLVFAVGRPFVRARGMSENRIVVILDSSASMQSTDVSPSRFDDAKNKALDIVKRMGPGDSMLVIAAGAKTRVVAAFSSDKKALQGAISSLKPLDTVCNMRQAMVLALSLVAEKSAQPPRIALLSDGAFGALTDLNPGNAKLDFIRIGKQCDNIAITGMDSRKTLSGEQQIFISLHNYSKRERKFNLELYLENQLIDIREEVLGAAQSKQEILKNIKDSGGRVNAKLDISDDLAADNFASVYLAKRRKLSVLMVSKGNLFLENALNLDPRTQLVRTDSIPVDFDKSRYGLVIFDRVAPPANLPSGGYMLINTNAAQGPAKLGALVKRPVIIDSARNHPTSEYVDFGDVRIAEAHYMAPKAWGTTIIEGAGGALAVAGSQGGRNFVQLSFDLLESDFPLHVGFPIFVANCLDWLVPAGKSSAGESIRTGQAISIDVPPGTEKLTVTAPDGSKQNLEVASTPAIFNDTALAGAYQVSGKGINWEFACNVASPLESNTVPKETFLVGDKKFVSESKQVQTNRELYGFLILFALAVLTFEWYAYHRRL